MGKTTKYIKNGSIMQKPEIIEKYMRNKKAGQIESSLSILNQQKSNNLFTRVNNISQKVSQQYYNISTKPSSYSSQVITIMHVLRNEDDESKLTNQSNQKIGQLPNNKLIQKQVRGKQNVKQQKGYDWPNIIFRLFVTLLILGAGICIFDFYHFYKYIQISSKIKLNENAVDQRQLLSHLEYLTWVTMPYHQYFYQQKIYQLGKLKEWDRVIKQSNKALRYSLNAKKFSVHYHKAMAHCFKQQFKKCQQATQQAKKYATRQNFFYLKDIYTILVSNGILKEAQVPSGRQFIQPARKLQQKHKKQQNLHQNNLQSL